VLWLNGQFYKGKEMHILLGLITAIGGVVWALYRLQNSGVDLNSFNPFHWARRRSWEKKLGTKEIHRLQDPIEAAALLTVAMATLEGEITREQKNEIIALFVQEFGVTKNTAAGYYTSSSHMLKDVMNMSAEVKNILRPTKSDFKQNHVDTLVDMLSKISTAEGAANTEQDLLLKAVIHEFQNV